MSNNIAENEPKRVFKYFEEIAAIPHGSRNTAAISDYLVGFAVSHNLKYRQDKLGNVIIWKEGKGDKSVILQGHMDMVCEKEAGCNKDMATEGLDLYIDGDCIRAKGTTLGGDDGIAVAMTLALLESDDKELPPIEAIFTVDEEIGMLGAAAIDVSDISGRTMINIDSEQEGVFTVSCAGGVVANARVCVKRDEPSSDTQYLRIGVEGLIGGHSGIEIHKNRANAIVILGRVLDRLRDDANIRITDISGGAKDNAIAVAAEAVVAVSEDKVESVRHSVNAVLSDIAVEYATTDPDIKIVCQDAGDISVFPMTKETTSHIIYMLTCLPNGIQRMSPDVPGLVQTSLNMGILKTEDDSVTLTFCVRSSVASEKEMLIRRLITSMEAIGGSIGFDGDYPGWQYRVDSPLRDIMREIYVEQYGAEPDIEAVHAGVECGFFADKLSGLDCVSIGPNLHEIHTYRESMEIESVARTYRLVLATLRKIASVA